MFVEMELRMMKIYSKITSMFLVAACSLSSAVAEEKPAVALMDKAERAVSSVVGETVPELQGAQVALKAGIPRPLLVAIPAEPDTAYFVVGENRLGKASKLDPGIYRVQLRNGKTHVQRDGVPINFTAVPPTERLIPVIGQFDVEWMCEKAPALIHDFCTTFVCRLGIGR
jgi:hypothetical protein